MDQKKIIGMLEQAGRHRYFKVVAEKGGNCCDACRALDGKTRRDDDEPVLPVHPHCRCRMVEIKERVPLANARFQPQEKHIADLTDFNRDREKLEKELGKDIDEGKFSAPGRELAPDIAGRGLTAALNKHLSYREGRKEKVYRDGKSWPTLGVGANLAEEHILATFKTLKKFPKEVIEDLQGLKKLSDSEREKKAKDIEKQFANITFSNQEIDKLFEASFQVAEKDVKEAFNKGVWEERRLKNGETVKVWNGQKVDSKAWEKQPELVRAVCLDLSFNTGGPGLRKYKSFLRAVKAEDYRRAALELLNSKDYTENIKPKAANRGLALRRRDAAIELSKLAEKQEEKRKRHSANPVEMGKN